MTQLRYFTHVVDLKSLTRAAHSLRVSQPALTRQMRLLEAELGTPLFFRHRRGVQPTDAGALLRDRADAILRLLNDTHAEISKRGNIPTGSIRIGFPPSIGSLLLAPITTIIQERFPQLTVQLVEGLSHLLQEWLLNDRIDLAIMTALAPNPLLVCHSLYEEDIWIFSKYDGPVKRTKRFSLADVARRKLIQTNRNNVMRIELEKAAHKEGLALNVVVEVDGLPVIKELLKCGAGSHVSPYSAMIGEVMRGELAGGPIKELSISRVMVHRFDRPVSQTVIAIMQIIRDEVKRIAIESENAVRPSVNASRRLTP